MRVSTKVGFMLPLAMLAGLSVPLAAGAAAVNLTSGGATYSGASYTLGFKFTVNSATSITSLGVYDHNQDGLAARAQIGLWDTAGNLLTSATIGQGGGVLDGMFRYVDITAYALSTGTEYVIGAYTTELATSLNTGQGGTGSIDPLVNVIHDRYSNFTNSFSFASQTDSRASGAWLGANFRFGNVNQVPVPGSLALVGVGLFALLASARRKV
jgi:hypothetical protein